MLTKLKELENALYKLKYCSDKCKSKTPIEILNSFLI